MVNPDIIQELKDLGSKIPVSQSGQLYLVPDGYFEGFATHLLSRIRVQEALASLATKNPYQVPAGYFDGLEETIMETIRQHADYQSADEELESISPLLSRIDKKPVFSVPDDYFQNFEPVKTKTKAKVISMTNRRWLRYASAAVVTSFVVLAGLMYFKQPKVDPVEQPQAWVEKNLKKVSTEEISDFVTLTEEPQPKESFVANTKPQEIKELLKDVPTNEIDNFLEETGSYADDVAETMLN